MRLLQNTTVLLTIGILVTVGCGTMPLPPGQTATIEDVLASIYGDGSAGDRMITGDEVLNDTNLQFNNFTVAAGVTVTIQSGAKIQCRGTFTNNGAIVVANGAEGGFAGQTGPGGSFSTAGVSPQAGVAGRAAQAGESATGDNVDNAVVGGAGGFGISEFESRQILAAALASGGGGAAAGFDDLSDGGTQNAGSAGGGGLVVVAMGGINNAATGAIMADGASGQGGGGGGGVVILASMTSVENAGMISARGGDGQDGDSNEAPSGGGGGGIVHLLAPNLNNAGQVDVAGGSGGSNAAQLTSTDERFAGAGGGASGGSGGFGGDVPAGAAPVTPTVAGHGGAGFSLQTQVDPTALF